MVTMETTQMVKKQRFLRHMLKNHRAMYQLLVVCLPVDSPRARTIKLAVRKHELKILYLVNVPEGSISFYCLYPSKGV